MFASFSICIGVIITYVGVKYNITEYYVILMFVALVTFVFLLSLIIEFCINEKDKNKSID